MSTYGILTQSISSHSTTCKSILGTNKKNQQTPFAGRPAGLITNMEGCLNEEKGRPMGPSTPDVAFISFNFHLFSQVQVPTARQLSNRHLLVHRQSSALFIASRRRSPFFVSFCDFFCVFFCDFFVGCLFPSSIPPPTRLRATDTTNALPTKHNSRLTSPQKAVFAGHRQGPKCGRGIVRHATKKAARQPAQNETTTNQQYQHYQRNKTQTRMSSNRRKRMSDASVAQGARNQ